jgi:thiol-disulfide isomerase/thioredoxin
MLALALLGALLGLSQPATATETPQNFAVLDAPAAAPEISFTDAAGQSKTLASFSGKVVLLNIWATWCAPCRKEMPTLDRLQEKLGGPDFEVVALSMDRAGPDIVKKFYAETCVSP